MASENSSRRSTRDGPAEPADVVEAAETGRRRDADRSVLGDEEGVADLEHHRPTEVSAGNEKDGREDDERKRHLGLMRSGLAPRAADRRGSPSLTFPTEGVKGPIRRPASPPGAFFEALCVPQEVSA